MIIVCTPLYGDVTPECMHSVLEFVRTNASHPMWLYSGGSSTSRARNELVEQALRLGADKIIWVDADMRFTPKTLHRMLAADVDVIGVVYPTRDGNQELVVYFEGGGKTPEELRASVEDGLLEVDGIGLGLAVIKRRVFEKFRTRDIVPFDEVTREAPSECYSFCKKWRNIFDGKVHVLVDATVGHVGRVVYEANLAAYLDR